MRRDPGQHARPLRVGLNLIYLLEDSGGSGRYAHELIPALLEEEPRIELTAFVNREAPASLLHARWASRVRWIRTRFALQPVPWHVPYQQLALPARALVRRLDLVHGLANVVPVFAPGLRTVVTLLDITWLHHPEALPDCVRGKAMVVQSLASARRADRVLAISEAARDDFVATISLDPARIDVTPLGVSEGDPAIAPTPEPELRARFGIGPGPLVLCVAQKRPHKNLHGLIRALAALERRDVQLVLPGRPTAYEAELRALAVGLGVQERVHLPDWVSEEDLEGFYRDAACFALPSLTEGFGLPVLEAMRRGVPVACSDRSALREVAGGAAALFDPCDPQAIAAAIAEILEDPAVAERLRAAGLERCRSYTWARTARATLASYRRALGVGA